MFVLDEYCARYGVRGCFRHLCYLEDLLEKCEKQTVIDPTLIHFSYAYCASHVHGNKYVHHSFLILFTKNCSCSLFASGKTNWKLKLFSAKQRWDKKLIISEGSKTSQNDWRQILDNVFDSYFFGWNYDKPQLYRFVSRYFLWSPKRNGNNWQSS